MRARLSLLPVLLLGGCGGDPPSGTTVSAPAESFEPVGPCERPRGERLKRIHLNRDGFAPGSLVVSGGDPIEIVNCTRGARTITKVDSPGDAVEARLAPRAQFNHTLIHEGRVRFSDGKRGSTDLSIQVTGSTAAPPGLSVGMAAFARVVVRLRVAITNFR